jgi:TonB-dependent starch-binding outer membrane protein SusC
VSNEKFLKQFKAISDLKLRLGWGQTGVQTIGSYQTKSLYNATTYPTPTGALGTAQAPARIANKELTWETSEQFNAGIDAGFLKNRVKLTLDVYKKTSIDLLQNFPIAPSNGFGTVALNFGSIENKGVDIMLDGILIEKPFKLSIGGNISFNRNKLLNLGLTPATRGTQVLVSYTGQGISTSILQTPANIFAEGKPIAMFWGFQTNGIVQSADANLPTYKSLKLLPGDVKFVDQNADGVINDFDKTFIGNPNPDFTYGFNASIAYKSLKLDLFFSGVSGRDIVNANYLYEGYASGQGSNVRRETYLEAWRPTKESNTFPRLGYPTPSDLSDRFIEDGSYLRLSNINLSYMITPKNKSVFSSLEFFISGRNLVLLTKYRGFDPDVNSYTGNGSLVGVDFNSYPNTKAVNFGFSANF